MWWAHVPEHVKPRLSFYNVPVSQAAFVAKLRETAWPDDFVVVKVDVDHPALEQGLVRRIAGDAELAGLIDELYLEYDDLNIADHHASYHVNSSLAKEHDTIQAAIGLMQTLRSRGVRAHFWV